MRDKIIIWGTQALCFAVLLLAVSGIVLHNQNLALQLEVNQRAQQLNVSQNFAQLLQGVAQNLAAAAVEKNDTAIRALLEAEGLKLNPPAVKAAESADKTPRAKK